MGVFVAASMHTGGTKPHFITLRLSEKPTFRYTAMYCLITAPISSASETSKES